MPPSYPILNFNMAAPAPFVAGLPGIPDFDQDLDPPGLGASRQSAGEGRVRPRGRKGLAMELMNMKARLC